MRIGSLTITHPMTQAPLEEHSNYAFRRLMKQFGASLVWTERVDAAQVARRDRRALRLLVTAPDEAPRAAQLSGAEPGVMADAARIVAELGFDLVDLNFECPIRRLLARGEGGALLADPPAIGRIVESVARAVSMPVTLKIRSGPDAARETAVEVARRAEDAGAAAVSIHARSVAQGYLGDPDWSVIARVKCAVRMAVIGGGGIRQAADAVRLLAETGADGVAIARGCLGNPWIFRQARAMAAGVSPGHPPTPSQRAAAMRQLVEGEFRLYGAPLALRRLPRTAGYFAQFLPEAAAFRQAVGQVTSLAQFRRLVRQCYP